MGQLFIFYTIKRYGPLVFATIQTVRQLLSIVLSILFFAHPLNAMEVLGMTRTRTRLVTRTRTRSLIRTRTRTRTRTLTLTLTPDSVEVLGIGIVFATLAAQIFSKWASPVSTTNTNTHVVLTSHSLTHLLTYSLTTHLLTYYLLGTLPTRPAGRHSHHGPCYPSRPAATSVTPRAPQTLRAVWRAPPTECPTTGSRC